MLDEEDFKNKYLQQPITFLTEENLDILETHCRRAVNFEKGFEHKVVLELLERYYQFQKEIQDKNNRITKLQKENESKEKAYNDCYCEYKHYKQYESIPKQVVKDKIKEIEEDKECYYYDWFLEERDIEKTINILEKILGDE